MEDVIFRWTIGDRDIYAGPTAPPTSHDQLCYLSLSVLSVKRYFTNSRFVVLYNGTDFKTFLREIQSFPVLKDVNTIDQRRLPSPFNKPIGTNVAWWKYVPITLGIKPIEIYIDCDLFFVRDPITLKDWIYSDSELICGLDVPADVYNVGHFVEKLLDKKSVVNAGFIGSKSHKWKRGFVLSMNSLKGESWGQDEQGAFNVAIQIAEQENRLKVTRVPRAIFSWFSPLGDLDKMEYVHFISFQKEALKHYYSFYLYIAQNKFEDYCHTYAYTTEQVDYLAGNPSLA